MTHELHADLRDRTLIDVGAKHAVLFWTKKLGIDEAALKAAVSAAGPTVGAVRRHLLSHAQSPGP